MSSNTANTLGSIKKYYPNGNIIPIPQRNFRLTESQKMGVEKMIWFFDSKDKAFRKFEIQLGFLSDGHTPHIVTLEGLVIVKHLNGVLEFEVYGEDGRDILNGMRECYMREGV